MLDCRKNEQRVCKVCNTEYCYCNHCDTYKHLPYWMLMFDKDDCYKIFNSLSGYNMGIFTKEQAIKDISTCDLSGIDGFNKKIKEELIALMPELGGKVSTKNRANSTASDKVKTNKDSKEVTTDKTSDNAKTVNSVVKSTDKKMKC